MAETIMVKAHPSLGNRVAMFERHKDHPNGEVFIAGQDSWPVEVARDTPEVTAAIDQKRIVVLTGDALKRAEQHAEGVEEAKASARDEALRESANAYEATIRDRDARIAELEARLAAAGSGKPDALAFDGLSDEQRKNLADAGITTADDVRRVSDDDLGSVAGIGPAAIKRLREQVG